jgi:hypothetical protein
VHRAATRHANARPDEQAIAGWRKSRERISARTASRQPQAGIVWQDCCQRTRFGNGRALTLEVTCLRIHMPRKTKQRDDADWTGEQNNGQHHTPRNKLLLVSLSDLHGN